MTRVLPLAAAALGGALVLALLMAVTGGSTTKPRAGAPPIASWKAPDGSFSIATPRAWRAVASGPAATVLERSDKRGVVVIRRRPPVVDSLATLAGKLERRLRGQIHDFQPAGARLATVRGSQRLVYTFARPAANQVQSIVVAPAGDRSYTLDLVADGDAPDVARELAGMVRSFAPKD